MKILVTGCAGFIGSHTCERLLKNPDNLILGIDNLNDYYDVNIKLKNLDILRNNKNFRFQCDNICDTTSIERFKPQKIIHLASMAGVRNSIRNPFLYEKINIGGFIHILEEAVKHEVKNVVYASSSSVYGLNKKVPFSESDTITSCNSPYACSKMAMEIFAKTYSQLYNISTIGLRFFTVYGPRGRPDMAPYKFLTAINKEVEFDKFGNGETSRDYTYIDDIVDGIIAALNKDNLSSEIYNLGNSNPVSLNEFIKLCEEVTNKKAKYKTKNIQLGDVPHTYADITKAAKQLNYKPKITLKEGLLRMNKWILTLN
jgi:UDP-glucuronate 4-epimerase